MDLRWRRFSVLACFGFLCILTQHKLVLGCKLVFPNNTTDVPPSIELHVDETIATSTVIFEVEAVDGVVTYIGDRYLGLQNDGTSNVYQLVFVTPIGDDYDNGIVSVISGSLTCGLETEAPVESLILVFINEVNTHDPTASKSEITMELNENLPVGLDLRQFYSTDEDLFYVQDEDRPGTPSSEISFELDDEFLEVERVVTTVNRTRYTPVIVIKKSLELAKSPFTATLIANDNGTPSKSTSIPITVNVKQANDGPPKFDKHYYSSEVLRTSVAGQVDITPRIHAQVENDVSVQLNFAILEQSSNYPQFSIKSQDNYVDLYLDNDVDPSWPDKVVHVVIQAVRQDNPARTDTVAVTIVFTDPVTTTTSTTPPTTEMTTLCPTEPPVTCSPCPTVTQVTCETVPSTQPMTCPTPEPCTCPTTPSTEPVTCPTLPITTETTCPDCICTTEHVTNPTNPSTNPSTNTTIDTTTTTNPVDPTDPTITTCPPCPTTTPGFTTTLASTSTHGQTTVTPNELTTFCQSIVTCDCTTPVTLPTTQSIYSTNSDRTTQSGQSTTPSGSTQSSQSTSTTGSTQSSHSTASNVSTPSTSTQHFTGSSTSTPSYSTTVCPTPTCEPCTTVSPFSTCPACDCTTVSVSSTTLGSTQTPPTSTACPTPTPCDCTTTSRGTTSSVTTSTKTPPTVTSSTTQAPTPPPATVYFERSHYAAEFLVADTNDEVQVLTVKAVASNAGDQITYSLTGGDAVFFDISQNGVITMTSQLAARSYNFKARATIPNGAFDETEVTVHVIESVDPIGPPRFNQSVYFGALKEYETSDHVAQVSVWDDTSVSFKISQVSPSSLTDNFGIKGTVITCVQPVSRANATTVQVTVWATRGDQISDAMVYIPIEDVNDQPRFLRTNYVIGYPKRTYIDQTVSMPIYRFQAVDEDEGENAVLAYELSSSSGDSNYFVESTTGTLYASYSDSEDRCQSSECQYTVTARDLNGAGLSAAADVSIRMLTEEQIQIISVGSEQVVDAAQIASDLSKILGYSVESLHATVSTSTKRLKASGEELVVYLYAVDSKGNFLSRDTFTKDMRDHSNELEDLDWELESTNEAALPSYAAQDVISDLEASKADLTVATGVLGAFLGLAILGALGFVFFVYYWKDGKFRTGSQLRRDSMEKHHKILASSRLPEGETNGSVGHGGLQNHAYTENEGPGFAESGQADKIVSLRDEVIVTVQPPTPEVKAAEPYLPPVEDEIYSPESPKPKKSIIKTDTAPDDKKDGGATNGSKSIKFNPNPDVIQLSSTGGAILNTDSVANNPNVEMEAL